MMTAELAREAKHTERRKSDRAWDHAVAVVADGGRMPVRAYFRTTREGQVHCLLHTPNGAGRGRSTGGGAHRASAALAEAIKAAGYELYGPVYGDGKTHELTILAGAGDGPMLVALLAVAECGSTSRARFHVVEL